jgi:hypothetical protein
VTGIVTASIDPTVPDVIKDIECTPGNETNKSGLQTPNASADITVATEGSAVKVSCTATSSDSDSALNRSQDIRLLMIDTTPPVTTANVTRLKTGAASVTLAATDNLSGVAQTQYRVNSGPWTAGMDFVLGVDGTYAIWFRSADVAGNVESTKSTTVTVVITPPPCKGKTCV